MNRKIFYDQVRKEFFGGKLSQGQVEGMEAILNEWDKRCLKDLRWLSYILATVYHETAKTMQPIEEYGKGRGRPYGSNIRMDRKRYTKPAGRRYYGRGFVQLTWYENYEKMSKLLFGDMRLLLEPELALDLEVSTKILFEGMLTAASAKGDFTGKSLEMYFNAGTDDPVNARRIINGLDRAELIAGYHNRWLKVLKAAA